MTCEQLILLGASVVAFSGVPGLCLSRQTSLGQRLATVLLLLGNGTTAWGVSQFLAGEPSEEFFFPSPIPELRFSLAIDGLSVVFLAPTLLISSLGSIYGLGYWKQAEHTGNGRKLSLFFGILTGAITLLVLARDGVTFLFAWELMAVSAFLLVSTEDHLAASRQAGWLYIAASHTATLSLFVMFSLMAAHGGGSFQLTSLSALSGVWPHVVFGLALVGFGIKAGIMPFHIWLPSSHANAPSHVSALLSGVLIKMGIYGLVRVLGLLPASGATMWWGSLLVLMGVVSGILGIAFALSQHDLKRLLAYSSIENIGIITIGIGLAVLGRSLGHPEWVVLGLGGALFHVWNHALFKSLLFLGAGSVIHAVHTREMNQLGGLAKRMPTTSWCMLIGATAICGLPPLNGFVGEWLLYLGLFDTLGVNDVPTWVGAALALPALALIGALAVACFTKLCGTMLLGAARTEAAQHAHESSWTMVAPLMALAAGCITVGVVPIFVAPIVDHGVATWMTAGVAPDGVLTNVGRLHWLTGIAACMWVAGLLGAAVLWWRLKTTVVEQTVTWDCGYAAPSPTMQYTGSSFAQMLVELFGWALRPRIVSPRIKEFFPAEAQFQSEVTDPVLEKGIWPLTAWLSRWISRARYFQQGSIHAYLFYMLAILILLLLWR